ncbi:MAG: twin-arginine translocase TatA/TatE family subunit [Bdellovibrionales bacterium]
MLDFGWTELVVIMGLAVLMIGPNEIPSLMRGLGNLMRRLSYIKYAFTQQFDDFMRDADLDDIRGAVNFETQRRSQMFDEAAEDEDVMVPLDKDYEHFEEGAENLDGDEDEEEGAGKDAS